MKYCVLCTILARVCHLIHPCFIYDKLYVPDEGYVMVRLGEKWGYINCDLQFTVDLAEDLLYRVDM